MLLLLVIFGAYGKSFMVELELAHANCRRVEIKEDNHDRGM